MRRRLLLAAAVLSAAVAVPLAVVIAPADAVQGQAQRLMYLHVPAAWSAYLCFAAVLVLSLTQLVRGSRAPDRSRQISRAAAEVGVCLTVLTLGSGSVWGALTWGTWWAWDARVTSTVAMGLVYVVYLAVGGLGDGRRGHQLSALVGVAGFLTVPLVHFSVLWWRTLHQPPTLLAPSLSPPIHPLMGAALASAVLTMTLLTIWAVWHRAAVLGGSGVRPRTGRAVVSAGDERSASGGAALEDALR